MELRKSADGGLQSADIQIAKYQPISNTIHSYWHRTFEDFRGVSPVIFVANAIPTNHKRGVSPDIFVAYAIPTNQPVPEEQCVGSGIDPLKSAFENPRHPR